MRYYLAGPYAARETLKSFKDSWELSNPEHICSSSWLRGSREITAGTVGACEQSSYESVSAHANDDLDDVASSDALVIVTGNVLDMILAEPIPAQWLHTGGRHVEMGYAVAKGMPVIVVGQAENVFQRIFGHHIPVPEFVPSVLTYLERNSVPH